MIGEKICDRRQRGRYEKREILARTKRICACCGKKLNDNTMTVEHVIPLSRGGWDGPKNTVALCETCNKRKNNAIYIPTHFYSALIDNPLMNDLMAEFKEWFQTVKEDFPIEKFPLIAPRANMQISIITPGSIKMQRKEKYVPGNILTWSLVGTDYIAETEAVTGISVQGLRRLVQSTKSSSMKEDAPVALYTLRKMTTDKLIALAGIMYNKRSKTAIIVMPWSTMPSYWRNYIFPSIIQILDESLTIGGYGLEGIAFITKLEWKDAAYHIMHDTIPQIARKRREDFHIVLNAAEDSINKEKWAVVQASSLVVTTPSAKKEATKEKD